jgi:hypothetical protein
MSSGHDDYAVEPIRGLPELPPAGETILWQGAPSAWEIARRVFHIRAAALYFLLLAAWRVASYLRDGDSQGALVAAISLLPIMLAALGLLALVAWLCARTSVYTITSRRVVMRIGIALPMAINIPFNAIGAASLRVSPNGAGDISLMPRGAARMAYSNLWPHVRPWRLRNPEPLLRGLPHVRDVAAILARAMAEALPDARLVIPAPGGQRAAQGPADGALSGLSVAGSRAA